MKLEKEDQKSLKRLGVAGYPIAHSLSPKMHQAAFKAVGLEGWHYQRLPIPPEVFVETAKQLPELGFVGINVAIPHKEAAFALADEVEPHATAIGAVNTLMFKHGKISATNTDATGFIDAVPFSLQGKSAVVLGAGGTARAVVWALLDQGATEVKVWNRTFARAAELCDAVGGTPTTEISEADLLINCTSVGMKSEDNFFGDLPFTTKQLHNYCCVIDFVYKLPQTHLIEVAQSLGIQTIDGLELLVHSGGQSFTYWTGIPAPLDVMSAEIK